MGFLSLYINSPTLHLTPLDILQQTMELNRIVQSRIIANFPFCEFGPCSNDGSYHLTLFGLLNKLPIQMDAASADTEYIGSYAWEINIAAPKVIKVYRYLRRGLNHLHHQFPTETVCDLPSL